MKKIKFLFFLSISFTLSLNAQTDCEKNINKASRILNKKSPFAEQKELFSLVEPCALNGDAKAENYLGMFYLNGLQTDKDVNKAFDLFTSSASKGYPEAQYNLGRLYKYGIGCELNFEKAIEWLKKSSQNGNQRAAYTIGYMYYKGYGVQQDYSKAVSWFEKSTDVMAKHFLGLCYYLGYGVERDEAKALELLLSNNTLNSEMLVNKIKFKQREYNESRIDSVLLSNGDVDSTYIQPEAISELNNETLHEIYSEQDIEGSWTGKLIQYDWSGKIIERILPINISFKLGDTNITVKSIVDNQELTATALWQDSNIYFESDMKFTLERLYPENPNELELDYTMFTLNLRKKEFDGKNYLVGTVDTFIEKWTEYGQPIRVVLRPLDSQYNIDSEIINGLANQEGQFIKLYPVPFVNSLTVQYQLESMSDVFIELVDLNNANHITILPSTVQTEGEYTYTIPINSNIPEGYYVVRLIAGNQIYTRLILKNN